MPQPWQRDCVLFSSSGGDAVNIISNINQVAGWEPKEKKLMTDIDLIKSKLERLEKSTAQHIKSSREFEQRCVAQRASDLKNAELQVMRQTQEATKRLVDLEDARAKEMYNQNRQRQELKLEIQGIQASKQKLQDLSQEHEQLWAGMKDLMSAREMVNIWQDQVDRRLESILQANEQAANVPSAIEALTKEQEQQAHQVSLLQQRLEKTSIKDHVDKTSLAVWTNHVESCPGEVPCGINLVAGNSEVNGADAQEWELPAGFTTGERCNGTDGSAFAPAPNQRCPTAADELGSLKCGTGQAKAEALKEITELLRLAIADSSSKGHVQNVHNTVDAKIPSQGVRTPPGREPPLGQSIMSQGFTTSERGNGKDGREFALVSAPMQFSSTMNERESPNSSRAEGQAHAAVHKLESLKTITESLRLAIADTANQPKSYARLPFQDGHTPRNNESDTSGREARGSPPTFSTASPKTPRSGDLANMVRMDEFKLLYEQVQQHDMRLKELLSKNLNLAVTPLQSMPQCGSAQDCVTEKQDTAFKVARRQAANSAENWKKWISSWCNKRRI